MLTSLQLSSLGRRHLLLEPGFTETEKKNKKTWFHPRGEDTLSLVKLYADDAMNDGLL